VQLEGVNVTGAGRVANSAVVYTHAAAPMGTDFLGVYASSVSLGWYANGNSTNTVYKAEKSTDNATFTQYYSGISTSALANPLVSETSYWFRVRAYNGNNRAAAEDVDDGGGDRVFDRDRPLSAGNAVQHNEAVVAGRAADGVQELAQVGVVTGHGAGVDLVVGRLEL
jgi:hypothetical protein